MNKWVFIEDIDQIEELMKTHEVEVEIDDEWFLVEKKDGIVSVRLQSNAWIYLSCIDSRIFRYQSTMSKLQELAIPLVKLLHESYNPHTQIVVEYDRVTILGEEMSIPLSEKMND